MNNRVDIQFKGLTTSPSDYACSDGELAICHNLVNEGGELRPIAAPAKKFRIVPSTLKLVYLHKTDTGTMLVVHDTDKDELLSTPEEDDVDTYIPRQFAKLLSGGYDEITSIGNMLIVTQKTIDHYFIKRGMLYKSVGNELPMLPKIAFGAHYINGQSVSSVIRKEYNSISTFSVFGLSLDVEFESSPTKLSPSSGSGQTLYNALMGALGSVEIEAKRVGGFISPFFVRFAYRLKDHGNSIARVSPPVLITPRTTSPEISVTVETQGKRVYISGPTMLSFLRYCVLDAPDYSEWDDIIEGIEVYVSSPIKTYNNLEYSEYEAWRGRQPKYDSRPPAMCMHNSTGYPKRGKVYGCYDIGGRDFSGPIPVKIKDDGLIEYVNFGITAESKLAAPSPSDLFNGEFLAPYKSPADLSFELESVSSFYHVATIPISDIKTDSTNFRRVPIDNGALLSLEARETLKEDYLSNYRVNASEHHVYNRRLIKVGSSRDITTNFALTAMEQYVYPGDLSSALSSKVLLRKKNGEYLVDLGSSLLPVSDSSQWLFYPDPDAVELRFYDVSLTDDRQTYKTVPLSRHDYLQGAFWRASDKAENFAMGAFPYASASSSSPDPTTDSTKVPVKSVVYVSEVDNPFFFPSGLTAQLGNGNVLALAATTLPISEGQQGQFPIMAFTDEGIWALSVSDSGSIYASNPMLRDVLLSRKSICSIPDGVAYTTAKGIMILRGKSSTCISDAIIDRTVPIASSAPFLSDAVGSAVLSIPDNFYLRSHLKNAKLLYSERTNRLFVIGQDGSLWPNSFALVYAIDNGAWSTMDFPYSLPVENYPTVYVQVTEPVREGSDALATGIYDLSDVSLSASGAIVPQGGGVVLTRPLTFGSRSVPKTVFESIVRGSFMDWYNLVSTLDEERRVKYRDLHETSEVKQVLYGSNNLRNWYVVNSSNSHRMRGRAGTPYKYYRHAIVVPAFSSGSVSLSEISYDVQLRLNNTLR